VHFGFSIGLRSLSTTGNSPVNVMLDICNAAERRDTAFLESLAVSDFSILANCRSVIPTCLANLGRPIFRATRIAFNCPVFI